MGGCVLPRSYRCSDIRNYSWLFEIDMSYPLPIESEEKLPEDEVSEFEAAAEDNYVAGYSADGNRKL